MNEADDLKDLLQREAHEGVPVDSGKFTISPELALKKLGAHQFPRPSMWVLKIVQAAVASEATALRIVPTKTGLDFELDLPNAWSLDLFQAGFFSPEVEGDRGFDHLKRGLWSVALAHEQDFALHCGRSSEKLVWSGGTLRREVCEPDPQTRLSVFSPKSEPAAKRGWLSSIVSTVRSAVEHVSDGQAIYRELHDKAYACPIPLTYQSSRVDNLGRFLDCCLGMGSVQLASPTLKIPVERQVSESAKRTSLGSSVGLAPLAFSLPSPAAAFYFVRANIMAAQERDFGGKGTHTVYDCTSKTSCIHWVSDGVILEEENLDISGVVSCTLLASAQDLKTDISGFSLVHDDEHEKRKRAVCLSVRPALENIRVTLSASGLERALSVVVGAICVFFGLCTIFFYLLGIYLIKTGVENISNPGGLKDKIGSQLRAGLLELQTRWPKDSSVAASLD